MRLATVQLSSCALVAFITLFLVLVQMDEKYPLLPAMPMGRWSYVEVGNWIRSLGPEFGRYASEFERIGIDGATLITGMTETDWNQMIPDPNHRQTIQTARDRELTRNSSADDDAAESELLNRIRSAAPAGSAITLNVGALGRGAQQNNFYALPRNPRFALYAMAVLGVGVLLSLLAAKDEPQWPATISELFHDPKTRTARSFGPRWSRRDDSNGFDHYNWITDVGVEFECAAKRTQCFVPFLCGSAAIVSFLSWQVSERPSFWCC